MGSVVRTTCDADQGGLQGGDTVRTCQADGAWSGPEPTHCGCPVLGAELAGTSVAFSHEQIVGSVATFSCGEGTGALQGALPWSQVDTTRTCQADGAWTGTEATAPTHCG
eukprot:COSAG04_NODE_1557_length_6358_cov_342.509506_7_plen_110_part_00